MGVGRRTVEGLVVTTDTKQVTVGETKRGRVGRWLRVVVGFAISGVFVYLFIERLAFVQIRQAFGSLAVEYLALGVVLLAVGYSFRIVRWWLMLRALAGGLPVSCCIGPFMMSIAGNNVAPLRAGDIVRLFAFRRQIQVSPAAVLGTVLIERLLDLLVLLAIFFVTLHAVPSGTLPDALSNLVGWLAAAGIVAAASIVAVPNTLRRLLSLMADWRAVREVSVFGPALRHLDTLFATIATLSRPRRLAPLIGLSVLVWLFEGSMFVCTALALGITGRAVAPFFAFATGTLATLIPSSPGYVGTFHYFAMEGLHAFRVAPDLAGAFAITAHLLLWGTTTLVGFGFFLGSYIPDLLHRRSCIL